MTPTTDWLADSGLEIRDGVVCGPDLNTGVPLLYAAGDIVRWYNPLFEEEMRVEHWTNAAEQGALAAANLLAEATGQRTAPYARGAVLLERPVRPPHPVPRPLPAATTRCGSSSGPLRARQFVALYGNRGRLRGVLGLNSPRQVMPFRSLLLERISWDDALAHARAM